MAKKKTKKTKIKKVSDEEKEKVERVFEQVEHNGMVYFKDSIGGVWNKEAQAVGLMKDDQVIMFSETVSTLKDMQKQLDRISKLKTK